jgi:hypothetical protein
LDPSDPWSNIGYWGDHQIIYLCKLLELSDRYHPGKLNAFLTIDLFSYANVPYRIKSYQELLSDPQNTIDFDVDLHKEVEQRYQSVGSDGKLIWDSHGQVYHVNLCEKLLVAVLNKFANFIPEAGIWMNTQRPEWNDANNALVGYGVSMVTLYYMRRFQAFFLGLLKNAGIASIDLSEEVADFLTSVNKAFAEHREVLQGKISDKLRREILDKLAGSGSDYRNVLYTIGFSEKKKPTSVDALVEFCVMSLQYIDHTISANQRDDSLYHAYNLMKVEDNGDIAIQYLYEMLEGQVAVLSSGYLNTSESLQILDVLKKSRLYRADQNSYMLYPNRQLPTFVEKNNIAGKDYEKSELLKKLVSDDNRQIVIGDVDGGWHFNADFRNAGMLNEALQRLRASGYRHLVDNERQLLLQIYENVFNHHAFTGRSGTFYKYEGLGSIYWHMVSKLLLAVQETFFQALQNGSDTAARSRISQHYYDIRAGIGLHKSPDHYGGFPTDPYSHTPAHAGAQQPGLTGQVKEDILTRMAELGVIVAEGKISFLPALLQTEELLKTSKTFRYDDVDGQKQEIELAEGTLAFTYCQALVVYHLSEHNKVALTMKDGTVDEQPGRTISAETSAAVFNRVGDIIRIDVFVNLKERYFDTQPLIQRHHEETADGKRTDVNGT